MAGLLRGGAPRRQTDLARPSGASRVRPHAPPDQRGPARLDGQAV